MVKCRSRIRGIVMNSASGGRFCCFQRMLQAEQRPSIRLLR
jgi:hypothetical protein